MLSIPTWINAGSALSYFTENIDNNYYMKEKGYGRWFGDTAKTLGLSEIIEKETLEKILNGQDKDGNKLVNIKNKNGERVRAGLDLTFSAPKSVSIALEMAKAYGDEELANAIKNAHEKAVEKILEKVEKELVRSRINIDGKTQIVETGNLIAGMFTHEVARPVSEDAKTYVDPSLHTHAVVMNMTKTADGKWHSIDEIEIFRNYRSLGQFYRNELASNLKDIGYAIEITDENKGFFELKGFDKDLIDEFSKRSVQISKIIEKVKEEYSNASVSEIKQMAAWKSREWKGEIDREKVIKQNRERFENLGYSKELIQPKNEITNEVNLNNLIEKAVEQLTNKQSVFTKNQLLNKVSKLALKYQVSSSDIEKAIDKYNDLYKLNDRYFTIKKIFELEKEIAYEIKNQKSISNILNRDNALAEIEKYSLLKEQKTGFALTNSQKDAAIEIISSKNMFVSIQGDAGTGKTTMLKAVNEIIGDSVKLVGISYTGKAASEIKKATAGDFKESGIESKTIAKFLNEIDGLSAYDKKSFKNSKIIIDEASMVNIKDAKKLIDFAKDVNAQLIFIGDIKQFKAIGAGDFFSILQDNTKTVQMNEVLRQKTSILRETVSELNNYNADKAYEILEKNNKIVEINTNESDAIINAVTDEFFVKNADADIFLTHKNLDDFLILTNTNKIKNNINKTIREKLLNDGVLKNEVLLETKESSRLSDSSSLDSKSYKVGDTIVTTAEFGDFKAYEELIITDIDHHKNEITVAKDGVSRKIFLEDDGLKIASFTKNSKRFAIGEKIVFEKNDTEIGVNNGEIGYIKDIDKNGDIVAELNGREVKFNINQYNYINYGYALTSYKSQGQTSKRVIVYMDSKMQNFNSFYVAVTRAEYDLKIFTDDKDVLKRSIEIEEQKLNAIDILTGKNVEKRDLNRIRAIERMYGVKANTKVYSNGIEAKKFIEYYENRPTPKQVELAKAVAKKHSLILDDDYFNNKEKLERFIKEYVQIPTRKQIAIAKYLSESRGVELPKDIYDSSKNIMKFIDETFKKPAVKDVKVAKYFEKLADDIEINRLDTKNFIDDLIRAETADLLYELQDKNNVLKGDDEFVNRYIDNLNDRLNSLSKKILKGKEISIDDFKRVGIDTSKFKTYDKEYDNKYIVKSEENFAKLESIKTKLENSGVNKESIQKAYDSLLDKLNSYNLKSVDLNYFISNLTEGKKYEKLVLPVDLKKGLVIENRIELRQMVEIDSLKSLLSEEVHETIGKAIFNNSPNHFETLASRLSSEHGVDINSPDELAKHIDKLSKPSELRSLINSEVAKKIEEFRKENNLLDDEKFEKYKKEIENSKKLNQKQKVLKGLLTFEQKNSGLYPIFESDLRKIDANYLIFADKTPAHVNVDVVKNSENNRINLLKTFDELIKNAKENTKSLGLDFTDKKEIDNIFYSKENRKKSQFVKSANRYLEKSAIDNESAKKYIAALSEQKTLIGMKYAIEQGKIEEITKSFLESRGVDTSQFEINKVQKVVDAIKMGSQANLELFKKHLQTKNSKEKENINTKIAQQNSTKREGVKFRKLSGNEIEQLKSQTIQELRISDPLPVLESLGIDAKILRSGTQYQFRVRPEDKTPSAFMYLKGGEWKFKDFGGSSGTIETVVMEATGMSYKEALEYCLDKAGVRNYLEDALDSVKNENAILKKEHKKRLEELKKANIKREKSSSSNSKVVNFRKIDKNDKKALEFLAKRGINKIPEHFYLIEGENSGISRNGKKYTIKNIGVGVITGNMKEKIDIEKIGADIHLINPVIKRDGTKLKTISYGAKDITIIPAISESKEYVIFESKMDYAAAYNQIDLSNKNIIIANGVGNHIKISDFLGKVGFERITFYNQYDNAGNKFVLDIAKKLKLKEFEYIKYENSEYKQDINDLHLNKVNLNERLRNADLNSFLNDNSIENFVKNEITNIKKFETDMSKLQGMKEFQNTLSMQKSNSMLKKLQGLQDAINIKNMQLKAVYQKQQDRSKVYFKGMSK